MAQNILVDLNRLRSAMAMNSSATLPDAHFYTSPNTNGLKTIRELAIFLFTCRKCEDAPCIAVCPANALEKDERGVINRHTNLCVSCKSCVTICPFGTMMTDLFRHHRNKEILYDLTDEEDIRKFVKTCPDGTIILTDMEESPENHIYRLNEKVLIRDYQYTQDN